MLQIFLFQNREAKEVIVFPITSGSGANQASCSLGVPGAFTGDKPSRPWNGPLNIQG